MKTKKSKTGSNCIKEISWGEHLSFLYKTKEDLIKILVPYIKSGLENNEFCMWVITSEFLTANEAKRAIEKRVKDLNSYFKKGQIEILDYSQWYKVSGKFDGNKVLDAWIEKEKHAIQRGFGGLRIIGDTKWLEKNDWNAFKNYEEMVNNIINKYKIKAICSYSIDNCGTSEIIDIFKSHRGVITLKEGKWIVCENFSRKKFDELLLSRNQINRLFKYVQSKRELEKRETGKEIHHEIAQILAVMKWRLNSLNKKLKTVEGTSSEDINMLSQNLDKVSGKAEKLVTELLPSVLNHFGFVAALEWQINDFQERTGIKCILNIIPERIPLSWSNSTVLFRISEKLLTNVAEHSHATEVKIELNLEEDSIVLKIIDDGIGITKEQLNDSESYGLLEVKESIKLLSGKIDIKGFPDKGTRIIISIKSDKENN